MSRPSSGGGGAAAAVAAAVAVEMLGGNAGSGKRARELVGVDAQEGHHHDSSRKHAKRPGGSTGAHAEMSLQPLQHSRDHPKQPQQHPQHSQSEHAQGQQRDAPQHAQHPAHHHQAHHQPYPRQQPQPAAPSRKPRGRGQKRESRGADVLEGKQSIVELPTLSSQEASKRHHEEELQV